jgi:hypothetical protein
VRPFSQVAHVEFRKATGWTVLSYSRMPTGLRQVERCSVTLPLDASDEQLGKTTLEGLAHSKDGTNDPIVPAWQVLGYPNNSAYMAGARAVSVGSYPGSGLVTVTAMRRVGSGFEVIGPLREVEAPAADAAAVGAAVRDAFTKID